MNLQRLEYQDMFDKLTDYLVKGGQPGLKLGFKCLDELYSHKDAGVTDWTGFPASGKTYFALECLMNLCERYQRRYALFVPDIGSDKEVVSKLIKMRTGKDFVSKYNNQISPGEMASALDWVMHHFVIFKKKDFKTGVSPIEFWEMVCSFRDDGGVVSGGLIDSWKNLKHIYSGREDLYLDEILSVRNEMAEDNNKHFHTIAHAVKTEADKAGKRRIPTAWDIKGGGSWYANGKNVITVDHPNKLYNRVDLYVSKVKPEEVGRLGSITDTLFLDLKRGRYYEKINHDNYFAFEHEEIKPVVIPQQELTFDVPTKEDDPDDLPF